MLGKPSTGVTAGRLFRWQWPDVSQPFGNALAIEPVGWKKGGLIYDHVVPGGVMGRWHRGVDLPLPSGTPVTNVLAGVATVPPFDRAGFGTYVQVDGARYRTTYGHLSRALAQTGDFLAHGDVVGQSGSSGNSTGPHVHWEVFDKMLGAWIEPWLVV